MIFAKGPSTLRGPPNGFEISVPAALLGSSAKAALQPMMNPREKQSAMKFIAATKMKMNDVSLGEWHYQSVILIIKIW
jgi:hypothetical protein